MKIKSCHFFCNHCQANKSYRSYPLSKLLTRKMALVLAQDESTLMKSVWNLEKNRVKLLKKNQRLKVILRDREITFSHSAAEDVFEDPILTTNHNTEDLLSYIAELENKNLEISFENSRIRKLLTAVEGRDYATHLLEQNSTATDAIHEETDSRRYGIYGTKDHDLNREHEERNDQCHKFILDHERCGQVENKRRMHRKSPVGTMRNERIVVTTKSRKKLDLMKWTLFLSSVFVGISLGRLTRRND